jgi:hypothetical protein
VRATLTGAYKLCAQVAATEASPANSPYVDTCVWPSALPPIAVAAGQLRQRLRPGRQSDEGQGRGRLPARDAGRRDRYALHRAQETMIPFPATSWKQIG